MIETKQQAEVIKWFRKEWPEHDAALRPALNGISRPPGVKGARMWNHMKSQGASNDDLDLVILVPKGIFFGLIVEIKGDGQSYEVTEGQKEQLDYFNGLGYCALAVKGIDATKAAITTYMEQ